MSRGTGAAATTSLILIRHGQSTGNRERRFGGHADLALTSRGQRQAEATAEVVASLEPTALITSDLGRARETAAAIAHRTGLAAADEPGLRERTLGMLDGMRFADVEAEHPDLWLRLQQRDPHFAPPGGETAIAAHQRVGAAIRAIADAHRGGVIALVSHGVAIHFALLALIGLKSPAAAPRVFFRVANASLSRVRGTSLGWLVETVNDTRHLAGLDSEESDS